MRARFGSLLVSTAIGSVWVGSCSSDDEPAGANRGGSAGAAGTVEDLVVVGTRPLGYARWGQAEMTGNLEEWTADWYGDYPTPCTDCANHVSSTGRVSRGGYIHATASTYSLLVTVNRSNDMPAARSSAMGARCARAVF